jgi:hypothetical protein
MMPAVGAAREWSQGAPQPAVEPSSAAIDSLLLERGRWRGATADRHRRAGFQRSG